MFSVFSIYPLNVSSEHFLWITWMQKKIYKLGELSQNEHIHITNTQNKSHNITSTPEGPFIPHSNTFPNPQQVINLLTSDTTDNLACFWNLCKCKSQSMHSIVSGFFCSTLYLWVSQLYIAIVYSFWSSLIHCVIMPETYLPILLLISIWKIPACTITISPAINIFVHVFWWIYTHNSVVCNARSKNAESQNMPVFNFSKTTN